MIKKYPIAFIGLLVGVLSFIQLFGLEKALLAIFLGAFAIKNALPGEEKGKRYAYGAVALGSLYILSLLAILVIKGPQIITQILKMK